MNAAGNFVCFLIALILPFFLHKHAKNMNNEPNDLSQKNKNRKKPANRASFVFSGTDKIVILFNWREFLSFFDWICADY